MRTIYSDKHLLHDTTNLRHADQPYVTEEVPARAEVIRQALQAAGHGPGIAPTDHGLDPILAVHTPDFVRHLQTIYAENAAFFKKDEPVYGEVFPVRGARHQPRGFLGRTGWYAFGTGTPVAAGTWAAAYWSAQCALTAADLVRETGAPAYALCRPPGHHAAADLYGGFCYLNNAAIAARHLGPRTAVLDIDYHHGNGTQEIFYSDPEVLFCSLHADPEDDYPYYWGGADERGAGPGDGFNRNFPLPQGTEDDAYLRALDEALRVIAGYQPRYLIVSAGLDIAAGDPVGGFAITADGFTRIGRRIAELGRPTLIVQEGGYLLETLGENAAALLQGFA
jgi:acetoin utilization deacetylase AcuC-like enzyme